MLKKMRWRFIGAAMAAFTAVVLTLLCVITLWNYLSVTRQLDTTLERLMEVDRENAEIPAGKITPPFERMEGFSPEVSYMIRFFSVHIAENGSVAHINQNYISSISAADARQYARSVLEIGRNRGYENGYRYLVYAAESETIVLFLNAERELQTMQSLLWITLAIACVSLAVVFILVILFSRQAIAPYLKNIEVQKQFITNASHELKTPLTAISTSADVLAIEHSEDEWVKNIQMQALRLSKLIGNLITLSRLDEENPFPARTAFSLSEVLWEISEAFTPIAQAKGKLYCPCIADDLSITGDRDAIQQMVSILLDNALKYSSDGGCISLTARHIGRKSEIVVTNTVNAAQIIDTGRLFERFYRSDPSHSDTISGTGIGLSIAKATVQAHGGKIYAKQSYDSVKFYVVV